MLLVYPKRMAVVLSQGTFQEQCCIAFLVYIMVNRIPSIENNYCSFVSVVFEILRCILYIFIVILQLFRCTRRNWLPYKWFPVSLRDHRLHQNSSCTEQFLTAQVVIVTKLYLLNQSIDQTRIQCIIPLATHFKQTEPFKWPWFVCTLGHCNQTSKLPSETYTSKATNNLGK